MGDPGILCLGIMWAIKITWAQVGITQLCSRLNPSFMWCLGLKWPQVYMGIKPPGEGSQDSRLRTNGVLVHHLCLERVSPSGHRWLLLLLFQTICLHCPERRHWSPQKLRCRCTGKSTLLCSGQHMQHYWGYARVFCPWGGAVSVLRSGPIWY